MYRCLESNLFLIVFLICLFSCRALDFYGDADKPFFSSGKIEIANTEASDTLNVVTFNIKKARKILLAISEMKQLEKKTPIDIYLLQEMNEKAVETIARELRLNYLYHPPFWRNSGNVLAVASKS